MAIVELLNGPQILFPITTLLLLVPEKKKSVIKEE